MLDGSSHTLGPPSVFFNMFEALHFGGNREGDYGGSLLGTGHGSNGHSVEPRGDVIGRQQHARQGMQWTHYVQFEQGGTGGQMGPAPRGLQRDASQNWGAAVVLSHT